MAHIILENVSLHYPIFGANTRSLKKDILKIATGGRLAQDHKATIVEALSGLSFELRAGDRLGLVGHNGAGKTTLLKVLAQIYTPTVGHVTAVGRTNCLFDIALGMDHEATGYENIVLRGLVLGLSREQAKALIPDVESFAELGEFINMPVRTYSAGMLLRLAFGIITSISSEILLLDEVVSVGDARFMEKARERITSLIHRSDIMVLSTHDTRIMGEFCNKVLWLEHGSMKMLGDAATVLEAYETMASQ